jgi:hypothetical protein
MVGVPVQGSNGRPRFKLPYPLVHRLPLVYPARSLMTEPDQQAFAAAYRASLDRCGVTAIRSAAHAIRHLVGAELGVPVVVLCFENLTKPGKWCHRTMFGLWWAAATGEEVPELGGRRIPELRSEQDAPPPIVNEPLF